MLFSNSVTSNAIDGVQFAGDVMDITLEQRGTLGIDGLTAKIIWIHPTHEVVRFCNQL